MCFHAKLDVPKLTLEKRFMAQFGLYAEYLPQEHINGFTLPRLPIVCIDAPQLIQMGKWGLLPQWASDTKFATNTLNAKIETLTEKPSFKNVITQRCWVLVNGFYEWKWLDAKGKQKERYRIGLADEAPFALAGIFSDFIQKETGELWRTFSIVTTEANALMAEIHNTKKRMPVVLTPQNEKLWLEGAAHEDFSICEVPLVASKIED